MNEDGQINIYTKSVDVQLLSNQLQALYRIMNIEGLESEDASYLAGIINLVEHMLEEADKHAQK